MQRSIVWRFPFAAVAGKGLFDLRSPNDPFLGRSSLVRDR